MSSGEKQQKIKNILGWVVLIGITAFAAWFRWHELGLKPLHHDEGVNAQFMATLVEEFKYRYNPYNFHGPLLYFLTYPVLLVTGVTYTGMRVMPVVFGTLAVPSMLLFKDRIGWLGVLCSALLIAIAPVEVYFSRTAIHEIYNFTFNFLFVGGFWLWWRSGKRWALVLGASSLACLFATKETTIITIAAVVPPLVLVWLFAKRVPRFVGGATIPPRLLQVAPAWWSRKVKAQGGAPEMEDGQIVWPPESAPRSVHAAAEQLDAAMEKVRKAAEQVMAAHRVARAQAAGAALPPPPTVPWSVREQVRGPVAPEDGRHWAVRFALVTYGLIVAGVVGVGVGIVQTKFDVKLPEWAKYAGAGGTAGLMVLISMVLPSSTVWWLRPLVLPFSFLRAAWRHDKKASRIALGFFLAIMVLLFSSFFTHPEGLYKFFEAFFGWGKTGVEGKGHEKVWYYWIESVLIPYYLPVLVVALPALIIGTIKRDALSMFTLGWFVLALAAYSAIPYKTPWCVLSFSGPLFIGVGIFIKGLVDLAYRLPQKALRPVAVAIPLLAALYPVGLYAQKSMTIQYDEFDVDYHSFIYVQNLREYWDFVSDMRGVMYTANKELGRDPKIWMVKTRNPLRYYVEGIADAKGSPKWDDRAKKNAREAELVMANRMSAKDIRKVLKDEDFVHRWYHERPGQKYDVFIKKSLWEAFLSRAAAGEVAPPTDPAPNRTFSAIRSQEYRKAEREKKKGKSK